MFTIFQIYFRTTGRLRVYLRHLDSTFFSYFLGYISNVEVFNVQLPQVGELAELCWKLPDSRITVPRAGETTWVSELH